MFVESGRSQFVQVTLGVWFEYKTFMSKKKKLGRFKLCREESVKVMAREHRSMSPCSKLLEMEGRKKKKKENTGEKWSLQFAWAMPCRMLERGIVLCKRFVGWRKPEVPARVPWYDSLISAGLIRYRLCFLPGMVQLAFDFLHGWERRSPVQFFFFFFHEMIAFSLALLYPASLVGTASILIYHYTVSLGKQGAVWSRYIWIYHS